MVTPGFRNAWTPDGPDPFPAGLNDRSSALDWVHEHRDELGITRIVLQGYINGGYGWDRERKLRELPSMVRNDGHYLDCSMMDMLVAVYHPTGENAENPLAWPYFATVADVDGLPPQVIAVDELDPLRDEGVAYFRLLQHPGVPVVGRVPRLSTHAGRGRATPGTSRRPCTTSCDERRRASCWARIALGWSYGTIFVCRPSASPRTNPPRSCSAAIRWPS
ncbi:MAG: uncharacterized protein JWO98_284 [Frankiales bacterium]|nr:uncharacterized protein [Frankiales bacterium]